MLKLTGYNRNTCVCKVMCLSRFYIYCFFINTCLRYLDFLLSNRLHFFHAHVETLLFIYALMDSYSRWQEFFFRLKSYLNRGSEPYRSQLQPLLYPLFVHLYLDQLCNGHKTPGMYWPQISRYIMATNL